MLLIPLSMMAQSNWELPDSKNVKTEKPKKADKNVRTATNPKYGVGAVSLVNGKIEWDYIISLPGQKADEIYAKVQSALEELIQQPEQRDDSRLTAVNKSEHIVAAYLDEELVFSRKAIARDFCHIRYTLIATAKEGELALRLCRITYLYDVGRRTEKQYTANELITDEEAMNATKTKFYPMPGKFRCHTIDRKDEVFGFIESRVK